MTLFQIFACLCVSLVAIAQSSALQPGQIIGVTADPDNAFFTATQLDIQSGEYHSLQFVAPQTHRPVGNYEIAWTRVISIDATHIDTANSLFYVAVSNQTWFFHNETDKDPTVVAETYLFTLSYNTANLQDLQIINTCADFAYVPYCIQKDNWGGIIIQWHNVQNGASYTMVCALFEIMLVLKPFCSGQQSGPCHVCHNVFWQSLWKYWCCTRQLHVSAYSILRLSLHICACQFPLSSDCLGLFL
jgi:hypothetical protein